MKKFSYTRRTQKKSITQSIQNLFQLGNMYEIQGSFQPSLNA